MITGNQGAEDIWLARYKEEGKVKRINQEAKLALAEQKKAKKMEQKQD